MSGRNMSFDKIQDDGLMQVCTRDRPNPLFFSFSRSRNCPGLLAPKPKLGI